MQQDVEELVERVAQKLGRGLSLEDLDGLLLAYSSNQSHADRVRVNFLLSKRVPVDVIAWQLSHGIATAVRPVVVPANEDLGMLGRVGIQQQGGQMLQLRRHVLQVGEDGRGAGFLGVELDPQVPHPEAAHQQRHAHTAQHAEVRIGRHDDRPDRSRNPMGELPRDDVHGDTLAEQEVHPDAVRMRLIGAVGEEQTVEILEGESAAQPLRHLLHELLHVLLLHPARLLPRPAALRMRPRRTPADT